MLVRISRRRFFVKGLYLAGVHESRAAIVIFLNMLVVRWFQTCEHIIPKDLGVSLGKGFQRPNPDSKHGIGTLNPILRSGLDS